MPRFSSAMAISCASDIARRSSERIDCSTLGVTVFGRRPAGGADASCCGAIAGVLSEGRTGTGSP